MAASQSRSELLGFGLISALVSSAILAVLLAAALPSWHSMVNRQRLKLLAQEVKDDLLLARSESRRLNAIVRMAFHSTELGTCYVVYRGPPGDCQCKLMQAPVCGDASNWIKHHSIASGASQLVQSNVSSLNFDPRQGLVSSTGRVSILASQTQKGLQHVVSITGRVRSCSTDPAIEGYASC